VDRTLWWLVTAATFLHAGCSSGYGNGYEQTGGPPIAQAIRDADWPTVDASGTTLATSLMPRPSTCSCRATPTDSDARELICFVVKPAVAAGDPPEGLGVHVHGRFKTVVDFEVSCPRSTG
jgi:hypothetical protein